MADRKSFIINGTLAGQTLAAVLRQSLGNTTWTQARHLISSRRVRVNGNVCLDDARRLKNGETVDLRKESSTETPAERHVRIVYSDADIVVVEKPAGIQSVRRIEEQGWSDERKKRQPVVLEVVEHMLMAARTNALGKRNGSGKTFAKSRPKAPPILRPRAVHRLDRDTSGLMLFALSAPAEAELVRRFKKHEILRVYRAVVLGNVPEPRTLESWIVRDRGDGVRGSVPGGKSSSLGQRAVTYVQPIKPIGAAFTVVECRLETGRTHQIRIHMAEIEHPLCGEKVYFNPRPDGPLVEDKSGAPRQALHSAELEFDHPTSGKKMRFESPWPADLAEWVEGLNPE
jgi:23S rRNA pseudouridine1911/1915/1917 synthase